MAGRPLFHREVGADLLRLREARGWSREQVVRRAHTLGCPKATEQTVRWLEEGKARRPDPKLMKALAEIYDADYEDMAHRIAQENYQRDLEDFGCDLPGHSSIAGSLPLEEVSIDSPTRLLSDRDERIRALETALDKTHDAALSLVRLAAAVRKGRSAHSGGSRRGGSHRTIG